MKLTRRTVLAASVATLGSPLVTPAAKASPGWPTKAPIKNEAENLSRCLASIAWADEIFVVDSQSTDGSQRIAEERGWTIGGEVGWQIRFERRFGPRTCPHRRVGETLLCAQIRTIS